ncbi:MAG: 1-acyl-sn-glycerol-3-phosphate acyltransferase [Pyrinomonadaceae bacterium]
MLSYWIGRLWLFVFGWKVEGEPATCRKFVLIAAPHTSTWDFPFMLATSYVMNVPIHWLGKHTLFVPPWGRLMCRLGGIPVDRRLPQSLVLQMVEQFKKRDAFVLAIPPEAPEIRPNFGSLASTE